MKYCTYVTVYALVEVGEGEGGTEATATLSAELTARGFVPYDGHEAQSAFLSEHQDADIEPDFGGPLVRYHSVVTSEGCTMGVFRSPEAARAWARRHPDRVPGGTHDVANYLAPPPESYTEDQS